MVVAYQLRNMTAITDLIPPFESTYLVATLVYTLPLDRPKYLSCLLNCTLWHHLRYTCTKYLIRIYSDKYNSKEGSLFRAKFRQSSRH